MKMLRTKQRPRRKPTDPYHHGDLRAALLQAAREIVAECGIEGLTLRACARRVKVSHAAPKHHFGNLAGLLAELAADGYKRMAVLMDLELANSAKDSSRAAGVGYVRFAMTNPDLFRIMQRRDLLDEQSARLRKTRDAVKKRLRDALRAAYVRAYGHPPEESTLVARLALAWSSVHGYANLWIEGPLHAPGTPSIEIVLSQLRPALVSP